MYEGLVLEIVKVIPIEGKDRIVEAEIGEKGIRSFTVVTGAKAQIGDVGIFFGENIQLSEAYASKNDLLVRRDETGKRIEGSGYLDPEKRRITIQKFGGVKSEGLFMPLDSLLVLFTNDTPLSMLKRYKVGDKLLDVAGAELCKRYPKPEPRVHTGKTGTTPIRAQLEYFPEHYDTDQLLYNLRTVERIPTGARVIITEKLEGTSHRVGYVKHQLPTLVWWKRTINSALKFLTNWKNSEDYYKDYEYLITHGTRRVTLGDDKTGYYGSNQFRYESVGSPLLHKGEMLFGEIVGFTTDGKPIQPSVNTKEFPSIAQQFGNPMAYNYGLQSGSQFYVYRGTIHDGNREHEYTWEELVARCGELNYQLVPVLETYAWDGDIDLLLTKVRSHTEANEDQWSKSVAGNHINEGVVVRFEYEGRVSAFKYKSFAYKALNSKLVMKQPEVEGIE